MNKELANNTNLSHYRILRKIGAGGMGEVYLAEDTRLDRKVAVKSLNEEFSGDADKLKRFVQEAKAASALNHPNILTVYEIGEIDGKNYIATEFIEGKTLREHLSANEQMPLNQILKIGIQIAEALSAAHSARIVHRDIKPENVMIRSDGYAKVLDFGLAKLMEKKKSDKISLEGETKAFVQTNPGLVMGTVSYMSPEQARGKEIDERTDIWSFGVVLYEMLSGKVPFTGETINHTIVSILEKEPLLLENLPGELQRIVRKALTKDKEMRYQTARDLLIDLKNLRRNLDIQGELERSVIPNREAANVLAQENETQIYAGNPVAATKEEQAAATQNVTTASSLEYALTQAKSHKLVSAIAAILLLAAISAIAYLGFFANRSSKQIESIAVMPFVNESGSADSEYLSDGMTETLIGSLSQIPKLNVKARSSVFRYKGKEADLRQIARDLNVQAILMGRLTQRGEQIVLSLELVDAQTENSIWSEQYNRKQADLINLQKEIARDVSQKLKTKLSGADEQKLAKNYTENAEAYRLYLQGRFYWNKRTPQDIQKSIEYFRQATLLDPNFALGYAGLGDAYAYLSAYGATQPRETMPKAKEAALKALSLDAESAEAHAALGNVLTSYDFDFAGAEREYKLAIELNPNYTTAHHYYGILLSWLGRHEESIAQRKRVLEIDPLSLLANRAYADSLFLARRYDDAIAQLKKTLELDGGYASAYTTLSVVYQMKGDYAKSVEAFAKYQELTGDSQGAALMRESFAKGGWQAFLRMVVDKKIRINSPWYSADIFYAALGERDKALAELNKAYENRELAVGAIKSDPRLDSLRDDPRFQEFLKKVSFP